MGGLAQSTAQLDSAVKSRISNSLLIVTETFMEHPLMPVSS